MFRVIAQAVSLLFIPFRKLAEIDYQRFASELFLAFGTAAAASVHHFPDRFLSKDDVPEEQGSPDDDEARS